MKKYSILIALWTILLGFAACQSEDSWNDSKLGYLYLEATTNTSLSTKSEVPENYKPKQLHVEIRNASGAVLYSTDDYEAEWTNRQFALPAGSYTIEAHSHGFDGQASGFNNPYYYGNTTATITAGGDTYAKVSCTLANVKVSVKFDSEFQNAFSSANVSIASAVSGIDPLTVNMGGTIEPIYIPVGNFTATVNVRNQAGDSFSMDRVIDSVKARDHYILTYKVSPQGSGSITVVADGSEREYTFTFNVPTKPTTTLRANAANTWSNFAILEGEVLSSEGTLDPAYMQFEYRKTEEDNWASALATPSGEKYSTKLIGLTPNTAYTYRMVYVKDGKTFTSNEVAFTTEAATILPNGNMEDWYLSGKCWYPDSEGNVNSDAGSFWDTSNPGAASIIGSITTPTETSGNTKNGKAAQLQSKFKVKFAAASLYTGQFQGLVGLKGAKLRFGQPFTARPTQFKGWVKYNGVPIDNNNGGPAGVTINTGDPDLWSAYIALVDLGSADYIEVNNTDMSTFPDYNTDDRVVAYGALPDTECGNTDWKKFEIDLVYRNLTRKPTHIIIVISSSKYGDYFTGGNGSTLYLDDLELSYGDNPTTK